MWLKPNDPRTSGTVGFYASHGSLIDDAIVARTGGDVVHVAVFDSSDHTIAACSGGIARNPSGNEAHLWVPQSGYDALRLNVALNWLHSQLGAPYGYGDVLYQVETLFAKDPPLLDKGSDCSDLATKFLWIAGVALPANLIESHTVSPVLLLNVLNGLS